VWTGFDYLGEPTPYGWPARSSYFGVVDLAGFPKDAYYLYQSQWTPGPVLHVFPHWNWAPGDTIDVWAYTNAEEGELFLNDASLGVRRREGDALHLVWRIPFDSGVLRVVVRTSGQEAGVRQIRTAGPAARVQLVPDRDTIRADGRDLSFVAVSILDRDGVPVPNADPVIRFRVEGNASIAGVDNGDPISHAPFQADSVRVFNGRAVIILRAAREPGTVTLTATAEGLDSAWTRIELARAGTRATLH
jgi:beta-galactosidase